MSAGRMQGGKYPGMVFLALCLSVQLLPAQSKIKELQGHKFRWGPAAVVQMDTLSAQIGVWLWPGAQRDYIPWPAALATGILPADTLGPLGGKIWLWLRLDQLIRRYRSQRLSGLIPFLSDEILGLRIRVRNAGRSSLWINWPRTEIFGSENRRPAGAIPADSLWTFIFHAVSLENPRPLLKTGRKERKSRGKDLFRLVPGAFVSRVIFFRRPGGRLTGLVLFLRRGKKAKWRRIPVRLDR